MKLNGFIEKICCPDLSGPIVLLLKVTTMWQEHHVQIYSLTAVAEWELSIIHQRTSSKNIFKKRPLKMEIARFDCNKLANNGK